MPKGLSMPAPAVMILERCARSGGARHAALLATVSAAALALASPGAGANPLASGNNLPTPSAAAIAAAQSGQQEAARAARAAQNVLRRATLAVQ
ncbi:hypothetical protein, partial [Hyphomicrobium sp. 2TAF46]|uniref:hypothetical protein n=1 Tax=Hyphomicrobium sp. 2TAF46 TaxID=3233019 RepID=UPI003F936968